MPDLSLLVNLLQLVVKDRTQLALQDIALRHRLAVYKRSVKRVLPTNSIVDKPLA